MGATFGRATPINDGESGAHAEGHVSTLVWSWRSHHHCWPCLPSPWLEPKATASATVAAPPAAGAWSPLWKGAEVRVTLTEKQLAAVYHTLLATEPTAGTALTKGIMKQTHWPRCTG